MPRKGRPTNSKGKRKDVGRRERKALSEEVGTGYGVRGRPSVGMRVTRRRAYHNEPKTNVADPAVMTFHRMTRRMRSKSEEIGRRTPRGKEGVVKEGSYGSNTGSRDNSGRDCEGSGGNMKK